MFFIISLSLVILHQANVEAVINLSNFGNLTYVAKGSKVTIPWTFTDLESDVSAKRWHFSNATSPDFELLGFIDSTGSYRQSQNSPFSNIEGTKTGTLIIKNINLDNNGIHRFVLTRHDGKDPQPSDVLIIIKEQPTAVINCSTTPTVDRGEDFVCLCKGECGNPPATATWSKDGVTLVTGYLEATLSLKNVKKTDTGSYTCRVVSHDLSDQVIVTLTVNFGPTKEAMRFPAEGKTAAVLNEQFTITCNAEGSPKPTYELFHNGTNITESVTGGKYTINSVSYTDAGEYKCVAKNNLGSTEKSFTLTVTGSATTSAITTMPTKTTSEGNSNGYECTRCSSGSEWYIVIVTLIGGIVIGMVLMYVILFLRRRGNKNEGDDQRSVPSRNDESRGEENIPDYQELDAAKRDAGDNYQSLRMIRRNPRSNETGVENEAGYQELNEVRGNRDDNYQSLNPRILNTS